MQKHVDKANIIGDTKKRTRADHYTVVTFEARPDCGTISRIATSAVTRVVKDKVLMHPLAPTVVAQGDAKVRPSLYLQLEWAYISHLFDNKTWTTTGKMEGVKTLATEYCGTVYVAIAFLYALATWAEPWLDINKYAFLLSYAIRCMY